MIFKAKFLIPLILFFVVALINTIIRWDVLIYEVLVQDDLIYLNKALIGNCSFPGSLINDSFICYIVAAKSIFVGRIIIIGCISIASIILFLTMMSFKVSRPLSFFASISIFAGLPFLSQATFITGTSPTLSIFFTTLALFLTSKVLRQKTITKNIFIDYLLICFFIMLASFTSTNFNLISFILIPCVVYTFTRYSKMIPWLLVSTLPALSFVFLQFSGIYSNHYLKTVGWVEISLVRVLKQIDRHTNLIVEWGGLLSFYFVIVVLIMSISIYCFSTLKYLLKSSLATKSESSRSVLLVIFLGILIAGFFATLLPTLFVNYSRPRYLCAPLLFIFCQAFVLIQIMSESFPNKAIYRFSVIISFGIAALSVKAFYQNHLDTYERLIKSQKMVRSFLEIKKDEFKKDAQVLIILNNDTYDSTLSFNHWSTHLARHVTKRQDIIAVIGPKRHMTMNPFTGAYSDHGSKYWHIKNGMSARKKMVGLDINRPTYIYKQVDGGFDEYSCIVVNSKEDYKVYKFINNEHVLAKQNNSQPRNMNSDCVLYSSQ